MTRPIHVGCHTSTWSIHSCPKNSSAESSNSWNQFSIGITRSPFDLILRHSNISSRKETIAPIIYVQRVVNGSSNCTNPSKAIWRRFPRKNVRSKRIWHWVKQRQHTLTIFSVKWKRSGRVSIFSSIGSIWLVEKIIRRIYSPLKKRSFFSPRTTNRSPRQSQMLTLTRPTPRPRIVSSFSRRKDSLHRFSISFTISNHSDLLRHYASSWLSWTVKPSMLSCEESWNQHRSSLFILDRHRSVSMRKLPIFVFKQPISNRLNVSTPIPAVNAMERWFSASWIQTISIKLAIVSVEIHRSLPWIAFNWMTRRVEQNLSSDWKHPRQNKREAILLDMRMFPIIFSCINWNTRDEKKTKSTRTKDEDILEKCVLVCTSNKPEKKKK